MNTLEIITNGINLLPLANEAAYLDPGSGSFILQLIIASAVGIGFALRNSWTKIKALFGKNDIEEDDEEEDLE